MPSASQSDALQPARWHGWRAPLTELCDELRRVTSRVLAEARARGAEHELWRPVGLGAGDVTFGLDAPAEHALDGWLAQAAARGPLSLLTEDAGWRHRGPAGELSGFDHGGPRIAIDPIDGTRNLMAGLRSAWTVVAFAGPGRGMPRLADVEGALVSEIPTRTAALVRRFSAGRGAGARVEEHELASDRLLFSASLAADADDRVDHAFIPVFRYKPAERPLIARLEAGLCARLAEHEGADTRAIYDDQYISSAGQLLLLAQGTYRAVFDPRGLVARRSGAPSVTCKPYDVAGAILCAQEAGAEVTDADGAPLDFPLDATTEVAFAGYANRATRARIEPHWLAALADVLPAR